MKYTASILAAILLSVLGAAAQTVEFDVHPRTLRMGEQTTAVFTFRNVDNPPSPSLPEVPGLIYSSPSRSQQSSVAIENGRTRSERVTSFTYQIIPTKAGSYDLQPPPLAMGGKTHSFPALTLRVAAADSAEGGGASDWREQVFARMNLSREALYVQEIFDVEFQVFTRHINLHGELNLLNLPSTGLTVVGQQELSPTRETVDGLLYDVRRFRLAFRALTQGEFVVQPTVRAHVLVQQQRARRGGIDEFFGGMLGAQRVPIDLQTEPRTLRVRALPEEGRPPEFAGAVGTFQMKASARPVEVKAGDPVTLSLLVEGRGNIDSVSMPAVEFSDAFRVYDAKVVGREYNAEGTQGRKLFEQVVIPRSESVPEIPGIAFAFFNPESGEYEVLRHDPIALRVLPSERGDAVVMVNGEQGRAELRLLGRDIAYLKPAPRQWRRVDSARPLEGARLAVHAIPALAALTVLLAVRRRRRLAGDVARSRRLKAPKVARAALAEAEAALGRGDRIRCFEQLWTALTAYFGHRLNLPPGEVEPPRVLGALREGGLDARHADCVEQLFHLCERERYASSGSAAWSEDSKAHCQAQFHPLKEALRACERIRL